MINRFNIFQFSLPVQIYEMRFLYLNSFDLQNGSSLEINQHAHQIFIQNFLHVT